jgi:hypothetical protein
VVVSAKRVPFLALKQVRGFSFLSREHAIALLAPCPARASADDWAPQLEPGLGSSTRSAVTVAAPVASSEHVLEGERRVVVPSSGAQTAENGAM